MSAYLDAMDRAIYVSPKPESTTRVPGRARAQDARPVRREGPGRPPLLRAGRAHRLRPRGARHRAAAVPRAGRGAVDRRRGGPSGRPPAHGHLPGPAQLHEQPAPPGLDRRRPRRWRQRPAGRRHRRSGATRTPSWRGCGRTSTPAPTTSPCRSSTRPRPPSRSRSGGPWPRRCSRSDQTAPGSGGPGWDRRVGIVTIAIGENPRRSLLPKGASMAVTDLDLGKYKLGWSDAEDYVFKPKKGLNEDIVREMSWMKGEPDWMRDFRLEVAAGTSSASRWPTGSATCRTSTSTTSTTTSSPPAAGRRLGRPPRRDQEHLREARHPRGRAQVPGRRHRPVRVRGRLPPQPRGPRAPGRHLLRHGHRAARVPRARPAVLRRRSSRPNDNKFAALNSAVWSGGSFIYVPPGVERRDAAAGLLPDQRREHGPVRAHADHRRRGLPGALHRGLLGAGVHHRLAALGGGRARRQALAPASPTPPSRTGRPTSTTWSPSGPGPRPRPTWSGSTATSAAG